MLATDEWVDVQPLKPTSRTLSGRIVKDLPWTSPVVVSDADEAIKQARLAVIEARAWLCRECSNMELV